MLQSNGKFIAFFLSFVAVINWKAVKCSNILSHFQWFDYAALDRLFQWPQIRLHTRECWLHHHLPHMPFYCLLPKIHKSGILNPKENVVPLWGHDLYLIARDKHRIQFFPFFFSIFFRILFIVDIGWIENPIGALCRCCFELYKKHICLCTSNMVTPIYHRRRRDFWHLNE